MILSLFLRRCELHCYAGTDVMYAVERGCDFPRAADTGMYHMTLSTFIEVSFLAAIIYTLQYAVTAEAYAVPGGGGFGENYHPHLAVSPAAP